MPEHDQFPGEAANMSTRQETSILWIVLVVLAVVVVLPLTMMAFSMPMMGMMGWWWGAGRGGAGAALSPLWGVGMMLLFLAVLVGAGYLVYRAVAGNGTLDRDRAVEELRAAYARGDLSDEEFERRRERLRREDD